MSVGGHSRIELEQTCALASGDPVFEAEGSHLIDQTRSRSDHLTRTRCKA